MKSKILKLILFIILILFCSTKIYAANTNVNTKKTSTIKTSVNKSNKKTTSKKQITKKITPKATIKKYNYTNTKKAVKKIPAKTNQPIKKTTVKKTYSAKNSKKYKSTKKPVLKSKKTIQPTLMEQINKAISAGETQKALSLLNKAALKDPYNSKIFSLAADLFYKNSQYEEAEMLARKAISLNQKDSRSYMILGDILLKNFRTNRSYNELELNAQDISIINECLRCYNQVSQLDLTSAYPHIGMAKGYFALDNKDKAYDELLKAKELAGNDPEALFQIGEVLFECQFYEKSKKYLERSISSKLKNPNKAHIILAQIYERLGNYEKAQAEYISTVQFKGKIPNKTLVGSASYDNIKTENIAGFVSTPEKIPQNINMTETNMILVSARFTEARDAYLKALQQDSLNPDALTGLAEVYYSQWLVGNYDAKKYYVDTPYFEKIPPNTLKMPLIKFRVVTEPEIAPKFKDALAMVANNQSYDFNDRLDAARALFLQGNFISSKIKLQELFLDDLADKNKLQVATTLYLDQNYIEADNIARKIRLPEYYGYGKVIRDRVFVKVEEADAIFARGKKLYEDKKYPEAITEFKNQLKVYPTDKKGHLYLAYAIQKTGKIEDAVKELHIYMNLETIYPSIKPELELKKIPVLIKEWENKNTLK